MHKEYLIEVAYNHSVIGEVAYDVAPLRYARRLMLASNDTEAIDEVLNETGLI